MSEHFSVDFMESDSDGWILPKCQCGWSFGVVPDFETAADVLMEHAYEAGAKENVAPDGESR